MIPTLTDVIDSIADSLRTHVQPVVNDEFGRSVLLTIDNLLRYVAIRSEQEGALLFEDNRDLEGTLEALCGIAARDGALGDALGADIAAVRSALAPQPAAYPSVALLTARALALRSRLDEVLGALQRSRTAVADRDGYGEARTMIRAYLGRSLERTGRLVEPAFIADRR